MTRKFLFRPVTLALMVGATLAATQANAAGFQLTEQSAAGLGRSYAGIGVDGTDISGAYYNPATMTLHSGTNVQGGVIGVGLNLEYSGDNGESENGRSSETPIPHMYLTHQINDQIFTGLAITVPFGMATSYGENWGLSHRGYYSEIMVIDINPSLAWKINDQFSIGAGVSYQYVDAQLKTKKSLGPMVDLDANFEADSGEWGWNLGMMWSPTENLRFGLSYRSEVEHTAKGTLSISTTAQNQALSPRLAAKGVTGEFDGQAIVAGPAWAMLTAAWDINQQWSVYGTLRWTDWSSFDRLSITVNGQEKSAIENKWRDTYFGSIGVDYRLNPQWTLRGGIGLETSPIRYADTRTGIIPDAKRLWLSLGASYHYNDRLTIDMGATHLRGIGERDLYSEVGGKKVGSYDSLDAYLFGVQLQYRF